MIAVSFLASAVHSYPNYQPHYLPIVAFFITLRMIIFEQTDKYQQWKKRIIL